MKATEIVWLEYRKQLLRFVKARVSNPDMAEDLVHDVLLRAYDKRSELIDSDRLEAWLYRIARNVIVDHYRSARPMEALPEDLPPDEENQALDTIKALGSCMAPLITRLPDDYQQALRLADLEHVPQIQAATRVGVSYSGLKSRVQRGRIMLKELLLQCCEIEVDHDGRISGHDRSPNMSVDCGCSGD